MNKNRNNEDSPAEPIDWKKDHNNPKVDVATNAKTKRSAITTRFHGLPSDLTSTLRKNQNQYPPRQVINAPICHKTGYKIGVADEVG